jgi:hypothetical protein
MRPSNETDESPEQSAAHHQNQAQSTARSNALAETVNGLYKTEVIYGPDQGPWKTIEEVELETLSWVHWWNYAGDRVKWGVHEAVSSRRLRSPS